MKRLLAITLVAACGGGKPEPAHRPTTTDDLATSPVPPPASPKAIEAPPLVASPLPSDPLKTTIHRLSNGMTVYISTDRSEPSVTTRIAVRAGSRNDPEASTGLAHYLEHMLFKGTSKLGTLDYAKEKAHLDRIAGLYADLRKPGADREHVLKDIDAATQQAAELEIPNELDQLYGRIGISGLNAFTNSDSTVYVTDVPRNRIEQWARVEAQRYSDAVFRLFWPELEAVYEEKNRALDNPPRRAQEAFMKAMFPHHGYGWSTTLGEVEHLKSPAYGDMEAFFTRYYTPGNMAIILAGDVDDSVLPILEREFAGFKRPAGNAVEPGAMPALHGRTRIEVPVPAQDGVILGWPLVSATHPDEPALHAMDLLLLDGVSGIIDRELLLPQKVASAASNPTFLREAGYFQLYADALAGQSHDDLEKMLLALVGKLKRGDFTDKDLATAVLTYEIRQQRQIESNGGRAAVMLQSFVSGQPWTDVVGRFDRLHQVTRDDVMRVATKYLTGDFLVVDKVKGTATSPKITKPGITPVKVDPTRLSPFAKSILDMPVTPIDPVAIREGTDYTRGTLPTGPVIGVVNDRNALFDAEHTYDVGRTDDKFVCLALEVLKVSGAGKRTAEQTSRELHELGLVVNTGCGKTQSSISLSGIDRNLDAGMALLREWLASPAFDDTTVKATVAQALTERANAKSNPRSIAGAQAQFARFGGESDLIVVASNKELEAITAAQLKKSLGNFLHWKHRTAYFGPRPANDVAAAIVLGDGKTAASPRKPVRFRAPNAVLATDQPTAQTQIWLIWPRRPANDADRAAGMLFGAYEQPVLFQEVREARGLAYTVFGGYGAGGHKADDASVFAFVGTQGDKTHDSLDAVLATLRAPIDETRFGLAKEGIAQEHRVDRIAPRAIADVVYSWQDQGENADPRDARVKRALELDRAKLEAWAKTALATPLIVSITGDRKKLDEAKLKKLAPVTFVPVDKLFGY